MHLAANAEHYKGFHMDNLAWDAESYLKLGNNKGSIVDIIIIADACALHLNLSIYQKGPNDNVQVIQQNSDSKGTYMYL